VSPAPDFRPGQTSRLKSPARGPSNLCWELAPRLRTLFS